MATAGKYGSMTVNERLYVSGGMMEFEKAVSAGDIDKVKAILKEVEPDEIAIKPILDQLGLSSWL